MRRFSSFHYFPTKNIQKFNSYLVPQPSSWITCCLKTFQEASRTFSRTSLLQKKVWEGVDMGWHGLTWVDMGWQVDMFVCLTVWTSVLGKEIHIFLFWLMFWTSLNPWMFLLLHILRVRLAFHCHLSKSCSTLHMAQRGQKNPWAPNG